MPTVSLFFSLFRFVGGSLHPGPLQLLQRARRVLFRHRVWRESNRGRQEEPRVQRGRQGKHYQTEYILLL